MPRANRRRRDERPLLAQSHGGVREEMYAGQLWSVRNVTGRVGASAERDYLCPGCQQKIRAGTPHIVVWPAEGMGGLEDRRHWHTPCWQARGRRHTTGAIR